MIVELNPNPNEHNDPSRYRLTGHRMSGTPTVNHPSRYRHENDNKVPQNGNTTETIQADSRRKRTNQARDEKRTNQARDETRSEGETRAAASEVAEVTKETDLTRRPKEKSGGAHLRQSTKWPGTGYKVANVTNDSNLTCVTRKTKEKTTGTRQRRSAKWPGAGYEVADLTQEVQVRGKKGEKSTETRSENGARRHKAGYEVAEETHDEHHTQEVQNKSAEAYLRRSEKSTWSGYEVADLTQDTRNTRETRVRSTGAHTNTVTGKYLTQAPPNIDRLAEPHTRGWSS